MRGVLETEASKLMKAAARKLLDVRFAAMRRFWLKGMEVPIVAT